MMPKGMSRMAHSRSTPHRWHTKANLLRWGARAMATITPVLDSKAMRFRVTMQNNPKRSLICDWELVTTPTSAGTVGLVVQVAVVWFGTAISTGPALTAILLFLNDSFHFQARHVWMLCVQQNTNCYRTYSINRTKPLLYLRRNICKPPPSLNAFSSFSGCFARKCLSWEVILAVKYHFLKGGETSSRSSAWKQACCSLTWSALPRFVSDCRSDHLKWRNDQTRRQTDSNVAM